MREKAIQAELPEELPKPLPESSLETAEVLEPVCVGRISELTGTADSGGGDRANIVWGEF
jgi:hypothetical protein